ncbi:MAG: DNA glycosylase [Oscillospiraceae bacterium]
MPEEYINSICFNNTEGLSLSETLDCGQCFRWHSGENGEWMGIIGKNNIRLNLIDGALYVSGAENPEQIYDYFDFKSNYNEIRKELNEYPPLKNAIAYTSGIRILRQDFFETLITFILSQNNNIPRIKGLVEALCRSFGEKIGDELFAFPDAVTLAGLSEERLSQIKCGFRSRYIIDAARKVNQGIINPAIAADLPLEEAEDYLCQIVGVGKKVADCTLLFGLNRLDAYPVDVWIKRAQKNFFPQGLPLELSPIAGIAQQFLFNYIRTSPDTEYIRQAEKEEKRIEKEIKAKKKAVKI